VTFSACTILESEARSALDAGGAATSIPSTLKALLPHLILVDVVPG
jgi:hypothetical protein